MKRPPSAMALPTYESPSDPSTTPAQLITAKTVAYQTPQGAAALYDGMDYQLASHDGELAVDTTASPSDVRYVKQDVAVGPPVTPVSPLNQSDGLTVFSGNAPTMSLVDLESLALANNPTIQALVATTQKAAGYRTQVGLRANPTVGYQAVQLADEGTDQHTAFIEQEFVTAGKLALNRRVLNEALRSQLLELETQKVRVSTDVRVKFYEALAAQERMRVINDFRHVSDTGVELAELRMKAQEGSKLDVLQAKVQKNEIDLALQQAQIAFSANWRELVAITGSPQLPPRTLTGELPKADSLENWESRAAMIVSVSPEYQAAQARITQARANLQRQGVQAIPNVTTQIAAGIDNGTNSGLINLEIGAPLPVFNKNQGNMAAARAEYCRAVLDAARIENAIKARLAVVSQSFDSALAAVSTYTAEILPNAAESLELAEVAYRAGETSFVQVLVARRTYFDSNLQFIQAQTELAQARSQIDGFVLTGALDPVMDESGDDSLRGLTFSQQ